MTEWILVLGLILVVMAIVLYRYRRQIRTAWFMYQTFLKFKRQVKPKQVPKKKQSPKETLLVRCPKCNKWTPQSESVKLKSNFYCSLNCMEQAVSFKSQ